MHRRRARLDRHVDPDRPARGEAVSTGVTVATIDAFDTFDVPDAVRPVAVTGARPSGQTLRRTLRGLSVVMPDIR